MSKKMNDNKNIRYRKYSGVLVFNVCMHWLVKPTLIKRLVSACGYCSQLYYVIISTKKIG